MLTLGTTSRNGYGKWTLFCLKRWGIASETLNAYFQSEKASVYEGQSYGQYYNDAYYTANKNEFYPIPYNQLYYVPGLYVQNKGY